MSVVAEQKRSLDDFTEILSPLVDNYKELILEIGRHLTEAEAELMISEFRMLQSWLQQRILDMLFR